MQLFKMPADIPVTKKEVNYSRGVRHSNQPSELFLPKDFMKAHSIFFDSVVLSEIHKQGHLLKDFSEKPYTRKDVVTAWQFKKLCCVSLTVNAKIQFIHASLAQLFHKLPSKYSIHFYI